MSPPTQPTAEDGDPIVASYNVVLRPEPGNGRRLLILQHQILPLSQEHLGSTTQVRMKRNAGMVEIDYAIDLNRSYDRKKGQEWGTSLQRSTAAKNGGSHGLAGGFSLGAPPSRARRQEDKEDSMLDWNEAVRTDKVLRTITYGGMAPSREDAQYMVAVFQGDTMYLTPAATTINLRPQLHHIDAFAESERRREAAAAANTEKGTGGPSVGRAIHMTIKTNGDEVHTETMADRLRAVQAEKWSHLAYIDEHNERAWDSFDQNLITRIEQPSGSDNKDDKGKAVAIQPEGDKVTENLPYLQTKPNAMLELMYEISGKKRPATRDSETREIKPDPESIPQRLIPKKETR